jgi:hypothetical protein
MLFLFFNKSSCRFKEIIFVWMVATLLLTLQIKKSYTTTYHVVDSLKSQTPKALQLSNNSNPCSMENIDSVYTW